MGADTTFLWIFPSWLDFWLHLVMWNEKLNFKGPGFIQADNSMSNYTVVLV